MVRKSFISSSYNHMGKEVAAAAAEDGSNEEVLLLRNGENNEKLKNKLCYGGGSSTTDVNEMVTSWPPRLYTCSFCKRRFKSAQALGGHMNVHRRARAMLRSQSSSSPWLSKSIISDDYNPFQHEEHNHFIYPNPNPHYWPLYSTPQHLTNNPNPSNLLPIINLTSCNCKHMLQAGDQYHHSEHTTRERVNKNNYIMVENQLNGRLGHRTSTVHQDHDDDMVSIRPIVEEDIDLELRLGF